MKAPKRVTILVFVLVCVSALLVAGCGSSTTSSTVAASTTSAQQSTTSASAPATTATSSAATTATTAGATAEPTVAAPARKYTIGVALVAGGEPFQESVKWAIGEEAKKYGLDVIYLDAGGYGNAAKQASQIEDLVQRKVDAIILWPVSYEGSAPAVDAAAAAGVPVITVVTPTKSEKVSCWVGVDDTEIGQTLATGLGEALGGKGKVAMINGGEGAAWSQMRAEGFAGVMKEKFPGIQIVDQRWTTALDPGTSMKVAEDLLAKFPDLVGMYGTTSGMGFGQSQAIESAGLTGKILLAFSAIQGKDDITLLKSGNVAVVTGEPAVTTGRWGLIYALKVLAGEKVPAFVPVPITVYTRDNIDSADFSQQLAPQYLK